MDKDKIKIKESLDSKQYYINDICEYLEVKFGPEFTEYMNKREAEREYAKAHVKHKIRSKSASASESESERSRRKK